MSMTPAYDGKLRLEGVSDSMKIQVRVGPSRIAGQDLFAAQDIHKGTRIIQYIGARSPKEDSAERDAQGNAYIFAFNDRYDIDGKTLKNTARYINHSCAPTCEAVVTKRTIWIVALRDIQAGEELSYNYGLTQARPVSLWIQALLRVYS
jgi:SET domain-containing protein